MNKKIIKIIVYGNAVEIVSFEHVNIIHRTVTKLNKPIDYLAIWKMLKDEQEIIENTLETDIRVDLVNLRHLNLD